MNKHIILICSFYLLGCSTEIKKDPIKNNPDSTVSKKIVTQKNKIDSTLIVIDTSSKLCWMKEDFSKIKKRFLNEWQEIFEWEKEINSINYAGFNDWRIPTIVEYRTINKDKINRILYRSKFAEIDSTSVWGKGPYSFWSLTTPNKNTASYISFIDGFATSGSRDKQHASPYSSWKGVELGMSVRLVRNSN